jgi:hypothetical protein
MEKQARNIIGHSNTRLCEMDTAREMGPIKQMWLNKGGVTTIVPLKILEKIWPVTCDSRGFTGLFVIHTNQSIIIVKNNSKGLPYLNLRELEPKVSLFFVCRWRYCSFRW